MPAPCAQPARGTPRRRLTLAMLACTVPVATCRHCACMRPSPIVHIATRAAYRAPQRQRVSRLPVACAVEDSTWDDGGEPWTTEPDTLPATDRALQLDAVAPQWRPDVDTAGRRKASSAAAAPPEQQQQQEEEEEAELPQMLPPLDQAEIDELAREATLDDPIARLTRDDQRLLNRSLSSIDYLGDWADPSIARDSIVLTCADPRVEVCDGGPEFTCAFDGFHTERLQLHEAIIERMLTSSRTTSGSLSTRFPDTVERAMAASEASSERGVKLPLTGGPPNLPDIASASGEERHIFLVVGVPGSGKDTVLKRYLRSLGMPLLDASADIVKEYLAAWGQDELSQVVRQNNEANGPGKHLLHAQYLHRESIMIVGRVVDAALQCEPPQSLILEKTLYSIEPVLAAAHKFQASGCRVHLLGTHIQPKRNWAFLEKRMQSGQAFGVYITKQQTLTGLTRYQENLGRILNEPELRAAFDSIHVWDCMASSWCVSLPER